MKNRNTILLVENGESILIALYDYLNTYFDVSTSQSISSAKEMIEEKRKKNIYFELIISDIYLSDDTAFSLIEYCKKYSPQSKIALTTSYDINEHIDLVCKYEIGHVVSKLPTSCIKYIYTMATKILTPDIFGIQKFFSDIKVHYPTENSINLELKNKEVFSVVIHSPDERIYWVNKIAEIFDRNMGISQSYSKLILEEITLNALLKAPRRDDKTYKFQKKMDDGDRLVSNENIHLDEEDYFILQYGFYDDFIIFVCQDNYGTLRKKEVLYRLNRHIVLDEATNLPKGLHDSHGRGFFLLREQLTHLEINIKKDHKTEIICLYLRKGDTFYKNISIYEIE